MWLALTAAACFADYRPDRDGAQTAIRLSVVDTDGVAVPDAEVCFVVFTTLEKYYTVDRRTDADGVCEMTGTTRGEVVARVRKDGYYPSRRALKYRDLDWKTAVTEHKWTHGIVCDSIVIKKVQNPARHLTKGMLFVQPPATNRPMPFDVMAFDWCAPYGKGEAADFMITYFCKTNSQGKKATGLKFHAENCMDGFIARKEDRWSDFKYDLKASASSDYQKTLQFGWGTNESGELVHNKGPEDDVYHIFRVRTSTNEVGNIITSNYGIIYGRGIEYHGGFTLKVQVNPVNNDTSLEHDWAYRNMMRERGKEAKRQSVD